MPQPYVRPEPRTSRFTCPRCHSLAQQEWRQLLYVNDGSGLERVRDIGSELDADPRHADRDDVVCTEWDASLCFACGEHSFWYDDTLVFPVASGDSVLPAASPDMPTGVAELYTEAVNVLPHSRRASAALCRAALERLVKLLTSDLNGKQTLDSRLAHLSARVSSSVMQILQAVRHVGNKSLHGEDEDDQCVALYLNDAESEMVRLFFEAVNGLVDELITRPKHAEQIFRLLPPHIQKDIKAKAERASQQASQAL